MGWDGLEIAHRRAAALLALCLAAGAFPSEGAAGAPTESRKGWEQLNLSETMIGGTKVYCEKALEPNLPTVERGLAKFQESRAKFGELLGRRHEILADIDRILGVTEPNAAGQDRDFLRFATLWAETKLTFYVVRGNTAKDLLRAGGQLPNCTYDRKTDTASYDPRLRVRAGQEAPANWDFAIPVPSDRPFEAFVGGIFDMLGRLYGSYAISTAIHEVTEMTLVRRIRPTDPYFRWFSDGFANAITGLLLARHAGPTAAQEFAAANDTRKYSHLERELNLRYWMASGASARARRRRRPTSCWRRSRTTCNH